MSSVLFQVRLVLKTLFATKKYRIWFLILSSVLFSSYLLLPVWLTPGNSFAFQMSLFVPKDFVMFGLLAPITSLLILMQVFLFWRIRQQKDRLAAVGRGGVGTYSAIFGGLLSSAACTSCIAAFVGVLGSGPLFFVLENRDAVVVVALALVVLGIVLSFRRMSGYCKECEAVLHR